MITLINNKLSFFINSSIVIINDKGEFTCEFQSILYFDEKWKLDFYEICDISSIKIGDTLITSPVNITSYMSFLDKIMNTKYWNILENKGKDLIERLINDYLLILNKHVI